MAKHDEKQMISKLIDWSCLMPFSTVFQLYRSCQCTYPCIPGVLLTSTMNNFFSKPLAAFQHNHYHKNGQRWARNESCCNDYHQSQKEYWPSRGSNQQSPVLKSTMLPTALWGSAWNPTLYHTIITFHDPDKESFRKHCGKKRKCWY